MRDSLLAVGGRVGPDDVRPRHAGPENAEAADDLFHDQAKQADSLDDAVRRTGLAEGRGIEARPTTTVAPQALLLMNNALVRSCADGLAKGASGRQWRSRCPMQYGPAMPSPWAGRRRNRTRRTRCNSLRSKRSHTRRTARPTQIGWLHDGLLSGADGVKRVYLCGLTGLRPMPRRCCYLSRRQPDSIREFRASGLRQRFDDAAGTDGQWASNRGDLPVGIHGPGNDAQSGLFRALARTLRTRT